MRRLDVLMLKSFVGPFLLTTAVANFILLIQYLLKYFDDFIGKNLGFSVFAELLFYFSLNMLQVALPLGVLVASLMTFGNLGENFELTAIKGSGISLLRTLRPIFLFVCVLSVGAFFFNNYAIPAANLKAYSLLYDIKNTKPALDIKEGAFYNGIPNYSIKARKKLSDGKTLQDVIIYDHTAGKGNKTVILADSCLMYTILDERYLKLELYNGNYYAERKKSGSRVDQLNRTNYYKMDMVFSLASFDLKRRKEELFQNNRQMKNIAELAVGIDSFAVVINKAKHNLVLSTNRHFTYHIRDKENILNSRGIEEEKEEEDSVQDVSNRTEAAASFFPEGLWQQLTRKKIADTLQMRRFRAQNEDEGETKSLDSLIRAARIDSARRGLMPRQMGSLKLTGEKQTVFGLDTLGWDFLEEKISKVRETKRKRIITTALNQARNIKSTIQTSQTKVFNAEKERNRYTIEKEKKYSQALACILMFMIGAPLGAIIKKGGLGMPTIIAILFFIIYYVFTSIGEKNAKVGAMDPYFAAWMPDMVLLPFGLFFLMQARIDARLFEWEAYVLTFMRWRRNANQKMLDVVTQDNEKDKPSDWGESGLGDMV